MESSTNLKKVISIWNRKINKLVEELKVNSNGTIKEVQVSESDPEISFELIKELISKQDDKNIKIKDDLINLLKSEIPSNSDEETTKKLKTSYEEYKTKFEHAQKYLRQLNEENKKLTDDKQATTKELENQILALKQQHKTNMGK